MLGRIPAEMIQREAIPWYGKCSGSVRCSIEWKVPYRGNEYLYVVIRQKARAGNREGLRLVVQCDCARIGRKPEQRAPSN